MGRLRIAAAWFFLTLLSIACGAPAPIDPPLPDLSAVDPEIVRAVESFRADVLRRPHDVVAWSRLGERYRAQYWFAEAALCYARCEQLEPGKFRWPYLVGKSLLLEDAEAAAAAFERALALDASYAPAHLLYGQILARLGRDDEADRAFQAALESAPQLAAAHLGRGQLAAAAGSNDAALQHLRRAQELDPRDGRVDVALAALLHSAGRIEIAERYAQQARSRLRRRPALDDPRARLDVEPLGAFALGRRGRSLLSSGRPTEALPLLRRAVEIAPDRDGPRVALGLCWAMLGRPEPAEQELREAVRLHPGNPEAQRALGRLLSQSKGDRLIEGIGHLRSAIEREPMDLESRILLVQLLARADRPGEADRELRALTEIDPEHPALRNLSPR